MNESLRESGLLLEGKCEALLEDLSIKEAQWSQKEDRLTAEVRAGSLLGSTSLSHIASDAIPFPLLPPSLPPFLPPSTDP